jgi:hypothetical protein
VSEVRCYAQRRINPFQGVTFIIEREISRALTGDGINWELQVAVEHPSGWGSLNRNVTERSYVRYAVWSGKEGQARFPAHPQVDRRMLEAEGEALLASVKQNAGNLPFGFRDRYERWLLDNSTRNPIALLACTADARFAVPMRSAKWQAALGQKRDFESAALSKAGIDRQKQLSSHLDFLENAINKRGWAADWIARDGEGGGTSMDGQQHWAAECFPYLPWTEDWQGQEQAAFADYNAWQAPGLLMLELPVDVRTRLEAMAEAQPVQTNRRYPLYPRIIDAERMKRIRIMARLQARQSD